MAFDWELAGAFAFGMMLGWNVYFVNRYRKGDISFGDITTLIGAVGGAAVLALYDRDSALFGAYGLGLGTGFFLYFLSLLIMVRISPNFDSDWFLDGRRVNPGPDQGYDSERRQTLAPMAVRPVVPEAPVSPVNITFHGSNPGEAQVQLHMPNPQGHWQTTTEAPRIEQVCKAAWAESGPNGPFRNACNFYAIEVAHRLGVTIKGTADQIIDTISTDRGWTLLADGPAAKSAAERGLLVIAGVPSTAYDPPRREGHLAVVLLGAMNPGGWAPAGCWGSTDPKIAALGGSGAPISNCFSASVKDAIVYRCRSV